MFTIKILTEINLFRTTFTHSVFQVILIKHLMCIKQMGLQQPLKESWVCESTTRALYEVIMVEKYNSECHRGVGNTLEPFQFRHPP
jgi:hypothetical protein